VTERPVRWVEGGDASAHERALIESAPNAEPPAGAEDRIWAALALKLPSGDGGGDGDGGGGGVGDPGTGTGTGVGGPITLGALGALKSAGIGALVGVVVAGAASFASPPGPPPAAHPSATVALSEPAALERTPAPALPVAPADPATSDAPAARRALGASSAARSESLAPTGSVAVLADSAEERASQLREESRALQAVRGALRRADAAGALATLEATRVRFPASVLGQEREALTIQALALGGQHDTAQARARAFLAKFPTSPHAPSLKRFAEP
jgi:hypothetical protein